MRLTHLPVGTSACLTRIVDGNHEIEIAELRRVTARIQDAVHQVIPSRHQRHVSNALLHLALGLMVQERGAQHTATTLIRLIDTVLEHDDPQSAMPGDFTTRRGDAV